MYSWGKITGGFFGFLFAGVTGALLGVFIGHFFDRGLRQQWQFGNTSPEAQPVFFDTTFLVMGYIAKADGSVSEIEIQSARTIMRRMDLNDAMRERAMRLFNQGKQADFNLEQALERLVQACRHHRVLLRLFVEIQSQTVMLNANFSVVQQNILEKIYRYLGFVPPMGFENFFNFSGASFGYQQHGYQQQENRSYYNRDEINLQEAYRTLNVTETTSNAEIKRAYRRLMSQHHPDKLVSKGLPEEMIKLATEKTQKIKSAYDRIVKERGI